MLDSNSKLRGASRLIERMNQSAEEISVHGPSIRSF